MFSFRSSTAFKPFATWSVESSLTQTKTFDLQFSLEDQMIDLIIKPITITRYLNFTYSKINMGWWTNQLWAWEKWHTIIEWTPGHLSMFSPPRTIGILHIDVWHFLAASKCENDNLHFGVRNKLVDGPEMRKKSFIFTLSKPGKVGLNQG